MTVIHGFELIREQDIPELKTKAFLYRHIKTGAELLSLKNDDENKVFGITFRTPPSDSTGVPHILEHSVLCGSRKYPVKEPFVELLKGSLHTFLNAMTYPDKTCYPVASQNLRDFYNLVDVYLDAVFHPRLTPFVLQQEGWHYELDKEEDPLKIKGVVFNEMKGAYSSPDNLINEYSMRSLFPDTTYGLDSGGDPVQIPDLTFEQFVGFHSKYYHPSNSRIFFYGDDNTDESLSIVDRYLEEYDNSEINSDITLQKSFNSSKRIIRLFAAGDEGGKTPKGMITLNWLLPETSQKELNLALHILMYILLGMAGSPLRKALIESGLGEDLVGSGLESELKQMFFSIGLKGVDLDNADRIKDLIINTLRGLVQKGIDPETIKAALNTVEFRLRENNTGAYPRGLSLMLRAMTTWLHNEDPLSLIAFEAPLEAIKSRVDEKKCYFEDMINALILDNPHMTCLLLKPETGLLEKENAAEEKKLEKAKNEMSSADIRAVLENTRELKSAQEKPDTPEALATIPMLKLHDLERKNKVIPLESMEQKGTPVLYHDLFTNGIAYMDIGFDLGALPQRYLPYIHLFGRSLFEIGTQKEDYVALTQRIGSKTGGIYSTTHISDVKASKESTSWLFVRGKAMLDHTNDMLDIIKDVLMTVKLDNPERFKQMALEAKARAEQKLVPEGHRIVNMRLRSHYGQADRIAEETSGLSYLFFLRGLVTEIDQNWPSVLSDLTEIHRLLINKNSMLVNVTLDSKGWSSFQPQVKEFIDSIPLLDKSKEAWSLTELPEFEGLTIPSQVNYVGKAINLYETGYKYHGSAHVICRFLRNSWLWDRVRVQGGAYGAFCLFDRLTGTLTMVSYRDPNTMKTIDIFDQSAKFLRDLELSDDELTKGIIGAIGDIDDYKLPDAKGYSSMSQHLAKVTDEDRQQIRDEVLGTTKADFKKFADVLEAFKTEGIVKILGSGKSIEEMTVKQPGWLTVTNVL
jgi:presequence protease